MSFWNTSNAQPIQAAESFEAQTDLKPIPTGTLLRSIITEAKWDTYNDDEYISIRWDVIDGEYKGRVIFQKIRVMDQDPKKSDKAKQMLAAIDMNAGGQLMSSGEKPTDVGMMTNLCNKPILIRVRVWSIEDENTGETKTGNWVDAVFNAAAVQKQQQQAQQAASQPAQPGFDDDIGF